MYLLGAVIYAFCVEDARPFPRIKESVLEQLDGLQQGNNRIHDN